jgi:NIMA-interacting peptidyl-prolyl cis-trans isomerase 1
VKHAGSRRPSSWRQETITRSKAVAQAKAKGIREKLVACAEANPDVRGELDRVLSRQELRFLTAIYRVGHPF